MVPLVFISPAIAMIIDDRHSLSRDTSDFNLKFEVVVQLHLWAGLLLCVACVALSAAGAFSYWRSTTTTGWDGSDEYDYHYVGLPERRENSRFYNPAQSAVMCLILHASIVLTLLVRPRWLSCSQPFRVHGTP